MQSRYLGAKGSRGMGSSGVFMSGVQWGLGAWGPVGLEVWGAVKRFGAQGVLEMWGRVKLGGLGASGTTRLGSSGV